MANALRAAPAAARPIGGNGSSLGRAPHGGVARPEVDGGGSRA
jgi:hypothetical protein